MNPLHTRLLAGLLQSCIVATPLLIGSHPAAAATFAGEPSCATAGVSNRDVRLAAKDDAGPAELRRYVDRTYPVYRVDVAQAHDQVARHREMVARCTAARASL